MQERAVTSTGTRTIPGFDPDVVPLVGLGLGLTGLTLGLRPRLAPVPLALTALAALLYRDPERTTPDEAGVVFAPSDGAILQIHERYEHRFLHTDALCISLLLSPFNVPVSRSPSAGVVRYIEHIHGEHLPVWHGESAERNTRTYIGVETAWGPLLMIQIAGPFSRHVRCSLQPGDVVEAGERVGTVRFGSRTDLLVQRDTLALSVRAGQRMTAGVSPMAHVVAW